MIKKSPCISWVSVLRLLPVATRERMATGSNTESRQRRRRSVPLGTVPIASFSRTAPIVLGLEVRRRFFYVLTNQREGKGNLKEIHKIHDLDVGGRIILKKKFN